MAESSGGRRGAGTATAVKTASRTAAAATSAVRPAGTSAGKTAGKTASKVDKSAVRSVSTTARKTAGAAARKPAARKPAARMPAGARRRARTGTGAASRAAEAVIEAAQHLPGVPALTARLTPPRGRAAADMVSKPEAALRRAKNLPAATVMLRDAVTPILAGKVDDWGAEYAYSAGVQAFTYGFPYIYNAGLRHAWVTENRDPAVTPHAPVNQFWHARRLLDASYRDGGCPNNDTLYSLAWVDVSREPVILSHPNMGDRYFAFELVAVTSDNIGYVGQRTTGKAAGHFAITGPGWKGRLPAGVRKAEPSPTPWLLVLGRTLVDGPYDIPGVRALQEQFSLAPLSAWGKPRAKQPRRRAVFAPPDPASDPLAPWQSLNAMLAENPPPEHHAVLLGQFAKVGIGPDLDVQAQPEGVRRGLTRAAAAGLPLLREYLRSGAWASETKGWRYPPPQTGRLGDDFLRRAAVQSLGGIAANDPAEAIYLTAVDDAAGRKLAPRGRYRLRFAAGELPPADAFWSLTAYTAHDMNLIANAAGKYSVGNRTPGIKREPDGGLTVYLQPKSPGQARQANWLPTSADQPWFVILRIYRPGRSLLQGTWQCPGLVRAS